MLYSRRGDVMERKRVRTENQKEYQKQYNNEHISWRKVSFNDKNADDEFSHLWDSVSPISDHILLDYMEQKVMQLAEKYDVGEEAIMQLIKAHREAIPANSNKSE